MRSMWRNIKINNALKRINLVCNDANRGLRNLHLTSTCLNRRIPYDLAPLDLSLNNTIEYQMFDVLKECEIFCRRMDIDSQYHNDVVALLKTHIFDDNAYSKTVTNMTNGYFLTQMYLAELIDQSYKSKLPARLTKQIIEFLMSRDSIITASNFVGFNDLIKKSNSYFKLSTIQDVQFSSEDKLESNIATTTTTNNNNNSNEDDSEGGEIRYKHDHVDENDILCDKFYQFIDLISTIWSGDKVKKLLEDFLLPNISSMNWLNDVCINFPTSMEYIKCIARTENIQFKLTNNYNYEITDHKHPTFTGYIFIDDHLISTYTDNRATIVRQHIAYNTLIKLINKARN